MTTREAIGILAGQLEEELVVCTTGYTCREMQACADRPGNFYMIGSMGLAAPIGLGIALCRPELPVVVLDGDGAILMGMGVLGMIGAIGPRRLIHVALDNEAYASTGNQATYSDRVALSAVASACGYAAVRTARDPGELAAAWREVRSSAGPAFLLVKCQPDTAAPAERVRLSPEEITDRFKEAMNAS